MFLKETRVRRGDRRYEYVQLVEGTATSAGGFVIALWQTWGARIA